MLRTPAAAFLPLLLAACSNLPAPAPPQPVSPCAQDEASYACQVERYNRVNVK